MVKNKKKSPLQKGLTFQLWVKNWLEEREWIVHNQPPSRKAFYMEGKVIYRLVNADLFNCIDLEAKKVGRKTLYIQAQMDSNLKNKIAIMRRVPWNENDNVLFFIKRKPGLISIQKLIFDPSLFNTMKKWETKEIGKIIYGKFHLKEGESFEF